MRRPVSLVSSRSTLAGQYLLPLVITTQVPWELTARIVFLALSVLSKVGITITLQGCGSMMDGSIQRRPTKQKLTMAPTQSKINMAFVY